MAHYTFKPWRYDGTYETHPNPFTGNPMEIPRNSPMTAAETDVVLGIVRRAAPKGAADGWWLVDTPDGGFVELNVRAADPTSPLVGEGVCLAATRRSTPDVMKLLYELLTAVDWVLMCEAAHEALVIVSSPAAISGPHPGAVGSVTCTSPAMLAEMLGEDGLEGWQDC